MLPKANYICQFIKEPLKANAGLCFAIHLAKKLRNYYVTFVRYLRLFQANILCKVSCIFEF
jgi:hypothetical protein